MRGGDRKRTTELVFIFCDTNCVRRGSSYLFTVICYIWLPINTDKLYTFSHYPSLFLCNILFHTSNHLSNVKLPPYTPDVMKGQDCVVCWKKKKVHLDIRTNARKKSVAGRSQVCKSAWNHSTCSRYAESLTLSFTVLPRSSSIKNDHWLDI